MSYEIIIKDYLKDKTKEFQKEWLLNMKTTCDTWAKNPMLVDPNDREIKETINNLLREYAQ